jgi:hypothetical protein
MPSRPAEGARESVDDVRDWRWAPWVDRHRLPPRSRPRPDRTHQRAYRRRDRGPTGRLPPPLGYAGRPAARRQPESRRPRPSRQNGATSRALDRSNQGWVPFHEAQERWIEFERPADGRPSVPSRSSTWSRSRLVRPPPCRNITPGRSRRGRRRCCRRAPLVRDRVHTPPTTRSTNRWSHGPAQGCSGVRGAGTRIACGARRRGRIGDEDGCRGDRTGSRGVAQRCASVIEER